MSVTALGDLMNGKTKDSTGSKGRAKKAGAQKKPRASTEQEQEPMINVQAVPEPATDELQVITPRTPQHTPALSLTFSSTGAHPSIAHSCAISPRAAAA